MHVIRYIKKVGHKNFCLHLLCTGKYLLPVLFLPLSPRQWAYLRLGVFQCFKLSLFKHNCVWANSRQSETACKCKRVKIKLGENNNVYRSKFFSEWYTVPNKYWIYIVRYPGYFMCNTGRIQNT